MNINKILNIPIIISIFIFIISINFSVFGQITLSYPKNRMVFQRNAQNIGHIYIEGTISGTADMLKARLTTLDGAGVAVIPNVITEWATISCVKDGVFSGAIFNQNAGWYNLEVQAFNLGLPVGVPTIIKVGVGEVFVIAGQSNATGLVPNRDPAIFNPTDDRINCVNIYDDTNQTPPEMVFSQLQSGSNIFPTGVTAWCWGVMGQQVANNWDVPVLFFNSATGNTNIFDWRASSYGAPNSPGGLTPYDQLKKVLINYLPKTGVRAILWHQGENDNGIFQTAYNLDSEIYFSNFKQIIKQSRVHFQHDLSWVIAKVSRVKNTTNSIVTNGQQMAIDSAGFNTFQGPLSDDIQPSENERDTGGVHFWGQGLIDLGNSWFSSVNNLSFITNSTPQLGNFNIIGCSSVKSGNWNDPMVWSNGRVPTATDDVIICASHLISLNDTGHVKTLNLIGELQFLNLNILKFGE
jgi:Carbohydrate esterase, sialic acid-specific acetylesterase